MLKRLAPAAILAALGACTGLDRVEMSRLYPLDGGRFEYRAGTNLFYHRGSDGWAEGERLSWLATWVDVYDLCAAGYEITSRDIVLRYIGPLGYPIDDIVYQGRCRT